MEDALHQEHYIETIDGQHRVSIQLLLLGLQRVVQLQQHILR